MSCHPTTYVKITFILILTLTIIGYSLFQARNIIRGPLVEINSPQSGAVLSESFISILGTAKNISSISMNDRPIFIDEHGRFRETLLLSYGYNIITIKATDKFGRKTSETLELVYK